eukprot:jgi/Hompol1/5538/HPOL_004518-RA
MSADHIAACKRVLRNLSLHKSSIWFLNPVDPIAQNIPNYFDIIKHPMDFSTIKNKLDRGLFANVHEFIADISLVFSNACSFNPPDTQVHMDALVLAKKFEEDWAPALHSSIASGGGDNADSNNNSNIAQLLMEAQSPERMVLDELMIHKDAGIFLLPVDRDMYPDYYIRIQNPIDLSAINTRVQNRQYATFSNFDEDIKLMFRNCFEYNRKGTVGYVVGKSLEAFYLRRTKDILKAIGKPKLSKTGQTSAS